MSDWAVEHHAGRAGALHDLAWPEPVVRTVWVLSVDRPAIVVGSAQDPAAVTAPSGVDVVRRRSGGGAVWLAPGGTLWVDILLPRGDALWDDDVGRSALWLGDTWARALGRGEVHTGPMLRTPYSRAFCFSGLAPGEVTSGPGGPKLVGISQRRTRAGARLQCVAYAQWDAEPLASAVGVPIDGVAAAGTDAGDVGALEAAFIRALPTPN